MLTSHPASRAQVRIFYYFLLGAAGGVTAWYVTAAFLAHAGTTEGAGGESLATVAGHGAVLGGFVGLGAGMFDGLASRSFVRVVKFGGTSLLCGLAAGAIALPLVQLLYTAMGQGERGTPLAMVVGTLCWVIFGGVLGLGEGVGRGSQVWKGLVGGMIGGVFGGGLYEVIGRASEGSQGYPGLLAFAVTVLGGAVGAAIALVTTILKEAWLVVETGPLAGTEINISKYVHAEMGKHRSGIIGSSQWESNIYLPGDVGVISKHAAIGFAEGVPMLSVLPQALEIDATTLVNRRPIRTWPLSDGDRIQVGETVLQYRHRR